MSTPADSKVSCKWGAPMGRYSESLSPTHPIYLRRVRLDSGGYDKGGAYWGAGLPLFCAWDDNGGEVYRRAADRNQAKRILQHDYAGALRFHR